MGGLLEATIDPQLDSESKRVNKKKCNFLFPEQSRLRLD